MKSLKKKIKQDFVLKTNVEFNYDKEIYQAEIIKKKSLKKLVRIGFCLFGVALISIVSIPIVAMIHSTSSIRIYQKEYSLNELKNIEQSTFKSLNKIQPIVNEKYEVSKDYQIKINEFSYNIYQQVSNNEDISFSPLGLFSTLFLCSLGSNDSQIINEFESIFNLSISQIKNEYNAMYLNDFISNDVGTMQMYNGMFLSNMFEVNHLYLNELTKYYCEAYSLDFNKPKDVLQILSWFNQKLNEENFMTLKDLQFSSDIVFVLFNTLYFNCKWKHSFLTSNTYQDYFETIHKQKVLTPFMSHSYFGNLYEYDNYLSCYDYYQNGFKIQYLVPKNNLNIHEALNNKNFLIEDENKIIKNKIIDLSVPKFTKESLIDFTGTLKHLGLKRSFSPTYPAFNYMFKELDEATNIYLSSVKQKNKITLNEDGTVVKSLTMASGDKNATYEDDTYQICLNQPFVYVIYDQNQLPIYLGNIDNL